MPREDITHSEITDDDMTRMVVEAIAWNGETQYPHVRVSADEGIVTLTGEVPYLSQSVAAEKAAKHVPGITQVINSIRVVPHKAVDDLALAGEVIRRLQEDPRLDTKFFEIVVSHGAVDIRGEVVTVIEKAAALDDARATYGVTNVIDHILILPQSTSSDHVLEEVVNNTLAGTDGLEGGFVHAHVSNGIVHLKGTMLSRYQREMVEHVVRGIPGTGEIDNDIIISEAGGESSVGH